MDMSNLVTVAAIVVICYLVGYACKQISAISDNIIPVIVGVCGGILGIIGMYVIPNYPANNILDAIAIGIFNGLASTGVNQLVKQLSCK